AAIAMAFLVCLPGASAQKSPVVGNGVDNQPYLEQADAQWALLKTYCVTCHNSRLKTAGLSFEALKPEDIPDKPEVWEKVVRKLRGRLMPPAGQPRPSEEKYDAFVGWLEGYVDHNSAPKLNPGRVVVHRLNRKEYANAVEDLLGLKINPAEVLPEDD